MALVIIKYACDRSSQLIGVIWLAVSLFAVSLSRSVVMDPLRMDQAVIKASVQLLCTDTRIYCVTSDIAAI